MTPSGDSLCGQLVKRSYVTVVEQFPTTRNITRIPQPQLWEKKIDWHLNEIVKHQLDYYKLKWKKEF